MTIFFTSDTHFDHTLMVNERGFSSKDEMNENLIQKWNEVVSNNDIVYHLGDFAFCDRKRYEEFYDRLKGKKHLILGNHDKKVYSEWTSVQQVLLLKTFNRIIWLSHYPHYSWPHSHYNSWHLYGHCHGKLKTSKLSIDVGVDNYGRPISLEEVISIIEGIKTVETERMV